MAAWGRLIAQDQLGFEQLFQRLLGLKAPLLIRIQQIEVEPQRLQPAT